MTLILNGESFEWDGQGALLELLASIGSKPDQVAVMVNDEVVVKSDRAGCRLRQGDRVEVLIFAGGG